MLEIKGIQILGVLIALAFLFEAYKSYRAGKFRKSDLMIWAGASVALIGMSFFPTVTSGALAPLFLGRGLDAFLVLGLLGAYALLFKIYVKIEESNRQLTDLTRKMALEHRTKEK